MSNDVKKVEPKKIEPVNKYYFVAHERGGYVSVTNSYQLNAEGHKQALQNYNQRIREGAKAQIYEVEFDIRDFK